MILVYGGNGWRLNVHEYQQYGELYDTLANIVIMNTNLERRKAADVWIILDRPIDISSRCTSVGTAQTAPDLDGLEWWGEFIKILTKKLQEELEALKRRRESDAVIKYTSEVEHLELLIQKYPEKARQFLETKPE